MASQSPVSSTAADATAQALGAAFVAHRALLWGVCYRMTGTAADADDLLQETFARALSSPPRDLDQALRPWLLRVALNVCRDQLRRRKLERYGSTWLPGPIETPEGDPRFTGSEGPEARYSRLESVSFAFLRALEVLTPTQRAVLILRDVLDLSVRQTAELLCVGEANVKTTHHRARAAMAAYDARRAPPSAQLARAQLAALQAFVVHLSTHNVGALQRLLAADVVAHNDADAEHVAARKAVRGFDKVLLFSRKTARTAKRVALCRLNGCPVLLLELAAQRTTSSGRVIGEPDPRTAGARRRLLPERAAVWVELDARGQISEVNVIVAGDKLRGLPWARLHAVSLALLASAARAALQTPAPADWLMPALRRSAHALVTRLGELGRRARARA